MQFAYGCQQTADNVYNMISKCKERIIQFTLPARIDDNTVLKIKTHLEANKLKIVVHASCNINLAHPSDSAKGIKSITNFKTEIKLLNSLIPSDQSAYIVFHTGKSLEYDVNESSKQFINNLINIMKTCPINIIVLIETPAGQGSELFVKASQFANMFKQLQYISNIGICIDTCHIFSAGYQFFEYIKKLERILDKVQIGLIHLNDSQIEFGSHKDRHASLKKGYIFGSDLEGSSKQLTKIIKWAFRKEIPIILETDPIYYQEELTMIKNICYPHATEVDEKIEEEIEIESKPMINQHISQILGYLVQATENKFKRDALGKAVEIINNFEPEIKTVAQIASIPGIGKGIIDRVAEILKTGTLKEYEDQKQLVDAINNLTQISGIGVATAKKIYQQHGIITMEQLNIAVNDKLVKLTKAQQSGLEHHFDINLRIPRSEIDLYSQMFRKICQKVDLDLEYQVVGSYRRMKPDSGDIDVLFVHKDIVTADDVKKSDMLTKILDEMRDYCTIDKILSKGSSKVLMIAHTNDDPSRRIDFLMTPKLCFATSLMYFTGSKEFNLIARKKAIMLGLKLNEYGLFDANDNRLDTPTEESIFKHLGLAYLLPENR